MDEFWTYGFFARNFGGPVFGLSMFAAWTGMSFALLAPVCMRRGWRWNRVLVPTGALVSSSAYLILAFLIVPAYWGGPINFFWDSDRWVGNLFSLEGILSVLLWPLMVLMLSGGG